MSKPLRVILLVAAFAVVLYVTWDWQPIQLRSDINALSKRIERLEEGADVEAEKR